MSDLAKTLRATTEEMANFASVPMELWNRHSNACLDAANRIESHERIISAMTLWLEANQPDVFKRGLWDTINLATPLSANEVAA